MNDPERGYGTMDEQDARSCTAFAGDRCIASGRLSEVARKVKEILDQGEQAPILIFDDFTSELVEVDFRGTMEDVRKRLEKPTAGPGSADASSGACERELAKARSADPAAPGWALSRAKSPCCRGTGIG
jgi:hypothetical protein